MTSLFRWIAVFFTALAFATPATSAGLNAFDAQAFAALQASGKPILVDVRADWCPTCKRQAPIISSLLASPEFRDYAVVAVDFDSQRDALRQFRVTQQSTLIVFKGKDEKGRSTGVTDRDDIAALLRKAHG